MTVFVYKKKIYYQTRKKCFYYSVDFDWGINRNSDCFSANWILVELSWEERRCVLFSSIWIFFGWISQKPHRERRQENASFSYEILSRTDYKSTITSCFLPKSIWSFVSDYRYDNDGSATAATDCITMIFTTVTITHQPPLLIKYSSDLCAHVHEAEARTLTHTLTYTEGTASNEKNRNGNDTGVDVADSK